MLSEACTPGSLDAVGDVVDGRYLLVKRAGAGAAGTVWVARDLVLEVEVAVKLLCGKHLDKREIVAQLAREAELASRMQSMHIVRVLGSGSTASHGPYVVYELLQGEDLGRHLARRPRLAIVETRNVVLQTCQALAHAHSLGVVHRDIKPSNLFVLEGESPIIKTLDFGLAEIIGRTDRDLGKVVGTLEYIAPEVLFGDSAATERSDLYGLAVVAYECLTGRVPYPGKSIEELVAIYASTPPPAPSTLRPGLTAEIDEWCERALCREPAGRFGSARELADALDKAIASLDCIPTDSTEGSTLIAASSLCDANAESTLSAA
jgi:serine/threonine-protein kinase